MTTPLDIVEADYRTTCEDRPGVHSHVIVRCTEDYTVRNLPAVRAAWGHSRQEAIWRWHARFG